jgi:hypothetical protein
VATDIQTVGTTDLLPFEQKVVERKSKQQQETIEDEYGNIEVIKRSTKKGLAAFIQVWVTSICTFYIHKDIMLDSHVCCGVLK